MPESQRTMAGSRYVNYKGQDQDVLGGDGYCRLAVRDNSSTVTPCGGFWKLQGGLARAPVLFAGSLEPFLLLGPGRIKCSCRTWVGGGQAGNTDRYATIFLLEGPMALQQLI